MQKESNVNKLLMLECSQLGGLCERCNAGTFRALHDNSVVAGHSKGFPDFICIMPNGKTYFVECKAAKGKQRDDQIKWQKLLEDRGHVYILYRFTGDLTKECSIV